MEKTSFNRVSNLGVQGIKSNQVDQSLLSEEELSQQFPSLGHINISTQVFNLLNLQLPNLIKNKKIKSLTL